MSEENSVAEVIRSKDYPYISNDPDENSDNFDPMWICLKQLTTDKERYQAIRKRWGNANIPDPQIDLTCRQTQTNSEPVTIKNHSSVSTSTETNSLPHRKKNKKRRASESRSRSCTRPYEQLICSIERNYQIEYSQLMYKQRAELQEMLQIQFWQLSVCSYGNLIRQNFQQSNDVIHLLSNHYQEVQNFIERKYENIDACLKYMEEVKAFFTFYQQINNSEVTLQMSEELYEHTVETEKMYSSYSKFYG